MYAIIATGGKQYRVEEGDTIRVEKLGVSAGDSYTFDQVLVVGGEEAQPVVPAHIGLDAFIHLHGTEVDSVGKEPGVALGGEVVLIALKDFGAGHVGRLIDGLGRIDVANAGEVERGAPVHHLLHQSVHIVLTFEVVGAVGADKLGNNVCHFFDV